DHGQPVHSGRTREGAPGHVVQRSGGSPLRPRRRRPGQDHHRPQDAGGRLPGGAQRHRPRPSPDPPGVPRVTATLTFTAPPPGLAPHVEFSLDDVEGAPGLHALRAAADATVRLFVVEASVFVPDYAPVFTEEHLQDVGAAAPDDASVLVVTTLDDDGPV